MYIRLQHTGHLWRLLGLLLIAAISGCTKEAQTKSRAPGEQLFVRNLCASCHGFKREGTWMGPPLANLKQHWQAEDLSEFIRDPASFVKKDTRIRELASKYRTKMVGLRDLGPDDRALIANWLLETEPVVETPN